MNETRVYHLRSQDRTTGTAEDFVIYLDDMFGFSWKKASLKVIAATVPWSFHSVNSSNNVIHFNEGGSAKTSTITAGNYTTSELAAEIASQMTTDATATISCSVDDKAGKFTISSDGATFELETTTSTNAMWGILGFSTGSNKTGATSYNSDQHYDMLGGRYSIHIHSSLHAAHLYSSNYGSMGETLALVPVAGRIGDLLHLTKGDESTTVDVSELPISSIALSLRWGDGTVVDLNGKSWEITLELNRHE